MLFLNNPSGTITIDQIHRQGNVDLDKLRIVITSIKKSSNNGLILNLISGCCSINDTLGNVCDSTDNKCSNMSNWYSETVDV